MVDETLFRRAANANIRSYWIGVAGLLLVSYATFVQPRTTAPAQPPTTSSVAAGDTAPARTITLRARIMEYTQAIGIVLIALAMLVSGAMHLKASRTQRAPIVRADDIANPAYPSVKVYRHKEARKHSDGVFNQIHEHFQKAGWHVESRTTDLPEHENGIRIAGAKGFDREMAKWGLDSLGIKWSDDYRPTPPEALEVIVGRYEHSPQRIRPLRILERYYMALALLRGDVGRFTRHRENGGNLSATSFINIGLAVEKMRKELVDLSPEIFTTSEALDFRETIPVEEGIAALSDYRVPKEIDHLMGFAQKGLNEA